MIGGSFQARSRIASNLFLHFLRDQSLSFTVQIQASALESGLGVTAALVVPGYTGELVLRFSGSSGFEVAVHDTEGRPITNFSVQVRKPVLASAHVYAQDGTFRLRSMPAGEYVLVFAAPGYVPVRRHVAAAGGKVSRLQVALRPLPPPRQEVPSASDLLGGHHFLRRQGVVIGPDGGGDYRFRRGEFGHAVEDPQTGEVVVESATSVVAGGEVETGPAKLGPVPVAQNDRDTALFRLARVG